jgi:fatty acid desaturase
LLAVYLGEAGEMRQLQNLILVASSALWAGQQICFAFAPLCCQARRWSTALPNKGQRRQLEVYCAPPTTSTQIQERAPLSDAATWHRERRRQMLKKYGQQIAPLERQASSQDVAVPLLALANLSLLGMSIWSGSLPIAGVVALAAFPGSMFSLWQLQILHDVLHGSLLKKGVSSFWGIKRKTLQDQILFWGSMPSVFGYYLYLKFGHLSHHKNVGDPHQASLSQLFASDQVDFEDGDVLFVAHRMNLKGDIGPVFNMPFGKKIKMSISKSGFNSWRQGHAMWNAIMFTASFMYERFMLLLNDAIVAGTGYNLFFPNKPQIFHDECAKYARWATALRAGLWIFAGWKSLLFLYLAETLWSIPPHPACAMFVTNHPSSKDGESGKCIPSQSTYAGAWYSIFTLGTNYHCEHHDFPTIPLHKLGELREIAPEFYRHGSNDNLAQVMNKAFDDPDFYACMDTGIGSTKQN